MRRVASACFLGIFLLSSLTSSPQLHHPSSKGFSPFFVSPGLGNIFEAAQMKGWTFHRCWPARPSFLMLLWWVANRSEPTCSAASLPSFSCFLATGNHLSRECLGLARLQLVPARDRSRALSASQPSPENIPRKRRCKEQTHTT